jgi:hypothetical protein
MSILFTNEEVAVKKAETFESLFSAPNRRFEIPAYQRAYSWGKKEIEEFLNDLRQVAHAYYLGHYLFEKKDADTLYVIDGQQRLTTCVIFFSCLHHTLRQRLEMGEAITIDLARVADRYLEDATRKVTKLKTVKDDQNFFANEIIQRVDWLGQDLDTKSKLRIREARVLFELVFSKTATETLENWCRIVEHATVTHLVVTDKVEAAQIFAFQNDRGKRLSNLDIIKSNLMLQILVASPTVEDDIEYIEREFSKIYAGCVRIKTGEDDVLTYYWRAVSGTGYGSPQVVQGVKDTVSGYSSETRIPWIKQFVSGLAEAFRTIEKIEAETYPPAQNLKNLNNMALAYPCLLKAYADGTDRPTIERLYRFLENVTFRDLLRGGRANIESRLNQFLTDQQKRADHMISLMVGYLREAGGWWEYWNDREMQARLGSGYFYQNRIDNYLLWRYELSLASHGYTKPLKVDYRDLISNESIEHIAPQTPTDNNPCANGYGSYDDNNSPGNGIRSGEWLHSLGNLMLISGQHNSKVSNRAFATKLASYKTDNVLSQHKELENFVTDKSCPVWDKDAIERRHNHLVKKAMEMWDLSTI